MFSFIVCIITVVVIYKVVGKLYRYYYWQDRKQRIETQIRYGLRDGSLTREAIDEMRQRGEL